VSVIVFGAAGFIGGWVCEELAARGDVDVLGCVRKWASATRLARRGISLTQIDFDNSPALGPILENADIVINATMPDPQREPDFAEQLYVACAAAGVRRFVQFSSTAVYGDCTGDVSEDTPVAPTTDYARGKVQMESRLRKAARSKGPQLFILRPSIVYGPFSGAWTTRYARRIRRGRWQSLGLIGDGICNLVYAQDVAKCVLAVMFAQTTAREQTFIVNGPEVVTWNEYIHRFGDALDIADRTTPNLGYFLAAALVGECVRLGNRWARRHVKNLVTGMSRSNAAGHLLVKRAKALVDLYPPLDEIGLLRRKVRYSSALAAREIGFSGTTELSEGLRLSAEWCRRHGIVAG
jgi:nucleoside-diphosphate-sugar epimerase